MRRLTLLLFILGIGFLLFKRQNAPIGETLSTPLALTEVSKSQGTRLPPQTLRASKKAIVLEESPSPEREPKTPTNRVKFSVQGGNAIAMGDIILGQPEEPGLTEGYAMLPIPQLWEKPEIPFVIDADFTNPERVRESLRHIRKLTGLQFVPYTTQPDAIVFKNGAKHCQSTLGRQSGLQPILLSPQCTWHEITHEVLHALGFIHEHSRADRDTAVKVTWENIDEPYRSQFEILPPEFLGPAKETKFDYGSIMLYDAHAFAKSDGLVTLHSVTASPVSPTTHGLSASDVERIKRMFRLE